MKEIKRVTNGGRNWIGTTEKILNRSRCRGNRALYAALEGMERQQPSYRACPDCGRETCWIGAGERDRATLRYFLLRPFPKGYIGGRRSRLGWYACAALAGSIGTI